MAAFRFSGTFMPGQGVGFPATISFSCFLAGRPRTTKLANFRPVALE
jgi:hypothetical protein